MMQKHINIVLNAEKPELMVERIKAMYGLISDEELTFSSQYIGEPLPLADEYLYSGGTALPTGPSHAERRSKLFKGILQAGRLAIPQFGICFGAQAFGRAYGAYLDPVTPGAVGAHAHHLDVQNDELSDRLKAIGLVHPIVEEDHAWSLRPSTIDQEFTIAARSSDGPEIFWHKTLPMAGVQFHAEMDDFSKDGAIIFGEVRSIILDRL